MDSEGRHSAPPDLAGERKLVTVMFADISGFTALCEELDPEEVRSIINACFTRLSPIIERYGGVVDKYLGDEIMALFGAPITHEDDAERACRAALALLEAVAGLAEEHGLDFGMHIGIETGTVIAGGLGADGNQQYSVLGDAANIASRLENASQQGEILVGPTAYHLAGSLFDFEQLPALPLQGKSRPVAAFRLIGLRSAGSAGRRPTQMQSPLVGRDQESAQLAQAVRDLANGTGRVIAVTGEPGLGKSRLVAEARQQLAGC